MTKDKISTISFGKVHVNRALRWGHHTEAANSLDPQHEEQVMPQAVNRSSLFKRFPGLKRKAENPFMVAWRYLPAKASIWYPKIKNYIELDYHQFIIIQPPRFKLC